MRGLHDINRSGAAAVQLGDVQDEEVEAVVGLWRRCDLVRPWNDPYRDIELARKTPVSRVLVGRLEDRVVASAMLGFDGHRGWVYYLAVDPELQGVGHGRALIAAAESWFKSLGAPKIQLMVRRTNAKVIGFYERLGYSDQDSVVLGKFFER